MSLWLTVLVIWAVALPLAFFALVLVYRGRHRRGLRTTAPRRARLR